MIEGISAGAMSIPPRQAGGAGSGLSADQSQLIHNTLNEFDADALTEADALSIVSTFSETGIQPGKGLEKAMESAGFDPKTVGELAGVEGPAQRGAMGPPPTSGVNTSLNEEMLQELYSLLDQYYDAGRTDEDQTSLLHSIQGILGEDERLFSLSA
ncbi:MAG: hypothetical protein HN842_02305 [Gammaproteobacteria bacterium]|jgi:hypothetical protein|nr:hypothetical protein [Gammaproteobacteria bacterium]